MVDPFLEDRINDADDKQEQHINISHQLEDGVVRHHQANRKNDRLLSDLRTIENDTKDVEKEANPEDHQQFISHGIRLMYKYLQPEAINDDTQPHKFMNGLFNAKAEFLAIGITKSVGIYINKSEKDILL